MSHNCRVAAVTVLFTCVSSIVSGAQQAELAVRWDPTTGGPADLSSVVKELSTTGEWKEDSYDILFYTVPLPTSAPEGAKPILRKRVKNQKKATLTFKYRSDKPWKSPEWQCPLSHHDENETKDELDVTFMASDSPKTVYSRSCEAKLGTEEAGAEVEMLKGIPSQCPTKMTRKSNGIFKVELWEMDSKRLIEVSQNASDDKEVLKEFGKVVGKLVKAGAIPIDASKTDQSFDCKK